MPVPPHLDPNVQIQADRRAVLAHLTAYSVKVALPGQEFLLASGGRSRLYIDAKRTTLHRTMHHPIARLLRRELEEFGYLDSVAGVVLGGAHLASLAASHNTDTTLDSTYNVVFVRRQEKDHGTRNKVEGAWSPRLEDRCVVIEDVLSTGATAGAAVTALRYDLFQVVGVVALLDRRPPHERTDTVEGTRLRSVFTIEDIGVDPEVARVLAPEPKENL